MLSAEKNRLLTETGSGTPVGQVLRHYWQPAALTEELAGERPVVPVRLMGEDLVLFRDEQGRYGLLDRHCCHRGADLCYGRREDGGLRCTFHGWLYDFEGRCLEQPAEPEGSRFHTKVRQPAYPCRESNGIVFAYLGPGDPPPFPEFDCFAAPDRYSFAFKGLYECNWLQALEVGIDPAHASFLHRYFEDEDPEEGYGQQFRGEASDSAMPVTKVLREHPSPRLEVEETDSGLRIIALRDLGGEDMHVRVTNLLFPNAAVVPMSNDIVITQWHVPVDDTHNYWYAMFTSYGDPIDKETMRRQRLEACTLPDYRPLRNKQNNYGFDASEQNSRTYTGMGLDINIHDQWAVESPGPIQDRTKEHLATSDKAITAYRRLLQQAIGEVQEGRAPALANGPPGGIARGGDEGGLPRGPITIDTIGPAEAWQTCWKDDDRKRRDASAWAKNSA